ncbi:glycosyltransferase family 2 protein [Kibdelosporangium lantanae]|uniref:Glycosyltransferase family 2 protein n=1 Tax=Kibdelosporangium lantanae TaxID=1497396 RepID=A0ABW3M7Y0_9PSEU
MVVVTYNNVSTIERCLASVPPWVTLTVVDNASTDGTPVFGERNPVNVGFSAAVNQAASRGKGDYILLLNPDAYLHEGALEQLLALAARFPSAGVYGGRAVDGSGRLDPSTCLARPSWWHALAFATGTSTVVDPDSLGRWRRDDVRDVPALTGSMFLVRRDLWEKLGGFDEGYWMYGEDVDLCMRAAKTGARPMFTPLAVHTHVGGGSSTRSERLVGILRGKARLYEVYVGKGARYALMVGVALRAVVSRRWRAAWRDRARWQHGRSVAG